MSSSISVDMASLTCALILVCASGCSEGPGTTPVNGSVQLDGSPVAKATVMFRPESGGRPAWAITGDDGTFELTTFENGDGARPGNYTVTIALSKTASKGKQAPMQNVSHENASVMEIFAVPRPQRKKWIVPEKYSKPDSSGLTFEVTRVENSNAVFELTSK